MRLTIATWNLLGGGTDNGCDARLRRQLGLLAGLDLDVAALQECKHWAEDESRLLHLAEEQLGMRGFLAESAHHGCHLAVLVRESDRLQVIEPRHERGHPYWHAVARVVTRAEGLAEPLHLASFHFAPSSPAIRLAEAEAFDLIARDGPLIAIGDANSVPLHDPDPPLSTRDPGHVRRKLDRRAAQAMADNGLLDVGALCADPTPTVGHEPGGLKYRCERCYTNLPPEAIISHQVITCADLDSDHHPVVCVFDLARAVPRWPGPGSPASLSRPGTQDPGQPGPRQPPVAA
jgi:endonuclease/exonuclease/phosphatase family metal-dependent hydrolase